MASADLGPLGAKQGPPVTYAWTPPSLMPLLLPWLAILSLLLLAPNRTSQTWWIWLPLIGVSAAGYGIQAALDWFPAEARDVLYQSVDALAFGLAALWLLAPWMAERGRWMDLVRSVVTVICFSVFACLVRQDLSADWSRAVGMVLSIIAGSVTLALAITLAGWTVRRRFGLIPVLFWAFAWLAVIWTGLIGTFFGLVSFTSNGEIPWSTLPEAASIAALICFATVLPFFILSFANSFFGERLRGLLHLTVAALTPAPGAPAPLSAEA